VIARARKGHCFGGSIHSPQRRRESHVNRGVVYWADGDQRRIFHSPSAAGYGPLDAATGGPIARFGDSGSGISAPDSVATFRMPTWSRRVPESYYKTCSSRAPGQRDEGARRGTSAPTTLDRPHSMDLPHDSPAGGIWLQHLASERLRTAGGANCWAGMTVDVQRGVVYVPLGSAHPTSTAAAASAPICSRTRCSRSIRDRTAALALPDGASRLWIAISPQRQSRQRHARRTTRPSHRTDTKSGFVYVFDRDSGRPLFPVEERSMPPSDLKGEQAWPTQPIPLQPPPFARQTIARLISTRPHWLAFVHCATALSSRPQSRRQHRCSRGSMAAASGRAQSIRAGVLYVNRAMCRGSRRCAIRAPRHDRSAVYATAAAGCHGRGPAAGSVTTGTRASHHAQIRSDHARPRRHAPPRADVDAFRCRVSRPASLVSPWQPAQRSAYTAGPVVARLPYRASPHPRHIAP